LVGLPEFCPLQHECYCDGYGICFGGTTDANLQAWLDILKQRERVDDKISSSKGEEGQGDTLASLLEQKAALNYKLESLKAEACELRSFRVSLVSCTEGCIAVYALQSLVRLAKRKH
jgi:hypothetical protein